MTVIIVFPLKPSALSLLILYACGAQESVASVWLSSHNRQRKSDKNTKVFYDPLLILASCSAGALLCWPTLSKEKCNSLDAHGQP